MQELFDENSKCFYLLPVSRKYSKIAAKMISWSQEGGRGICVLLRSAAKVYRLKYQTLVAFFNSDDMNFSYFSNDRKISELLPSIKGWRKKNVKIGHKNVKIGTVAKAFPHKII